MNGNQSMDANLWHRITWICIKSTWGQVEWHLLFASSVHLYQMNRVEPDGLLHIYIIDMVIEQSQSIVTSQSKYVCSRDT